ncbi:MAG: hypothetical protein L0332_19335 [Chloroflexi bacterium]|nr:hypothetical protein [Chloroflexota bacterium]MCI0578051.1 hypothetical protein [Chloroflexota bacterium]MCI0649265.1 hypothetical protein [Chloroflexota bacterium]MCI0728849.1 hypothetical protein [Chloroflexota bacterium]
MDEQPKRGRFELNAGSGMALGVIVAAVIALIVSLITGDNDIWIWAIPVGVAVGLAIGARAGRRGGG